MQERRSNIHTRAKIPTCNNTTSYEKSLLTIEVMEKTLSQCCGGFLKLFSNQGWDILPVTLPSEGLVQAVWAWFCLILTAAHRPAKKTYNSVWFRRTDMGRWISENWIYSWWNYSRLINLGTNLFPKPALPCCFPILS